MEPDGSYLSESASDVTFVVINWNGRRFLEIVLPSIFRQTIGGFSVRVVDDASTDDSREYVEREWPQVEFLAHTKNVGMTRNFNQAIDSVTTPYVALLNNDLELAPDWLRALRDALESHPQAAAADCKMLAYDDRTRFDGAGDLLTTAMLPGRRGNGEIDNGQYDEPTEVFSACAGAALFRRSAFEDVGPFDGDLFAYLEDVDWGLRARLRGWSAIYEPRAVAFHIGSATTKQEPGRWSHLGPRNRIYLVVKNLPLRLLLRYAGRIVATEIYCLRVDARTPGLARKRLLGWWQALLMLPLALRKRRSIQHGRRVSVAESRLP